MPLKPYLIRDVELSRGSVDDDGGNRYAHLSQNVPDGFVTDLQTDLNALGFDCGEPDGAFGADTKGAVQAFREAAGLPGSGVVDAASRVALVRWLEGGHTRTNPPPAPAPAPGASAEGLQLISPRVPHFSQGDPAWASRVLGRNHTIQKSGCAISCVAMVLKFMGRDVDPGVLDAFLDSRGGYSDSVVWGVAGQCGGQALDYQRLSGGADVLLAKVHERIGANRPTLVRVDYGIDPDLKYNHFVLAVGRTAQGDIVMNDPASRLGDGYAAAAPDNVIQTTGRKGGYQIVQLDWYD